jgi:hypothetical protein
MTSNPPSEHELPDDVNRWPGDPAELLGVTWDVPRRDLKRAYSRLIRRFKPEHAPEEFRRLREAFEQIDRHLEFREQFQLHFTVQQEPDGNGDAGTTDDGATAKTPGELTSGVETSDEQTSDGITSDGSAVASEGTGEPGDPSAPKPVHDATATPVHDATARPRPTANEADQLWQRALDGDDLKPVYAQLAELAGRRPPTEIGCARLYWLLTIHPEFDPDRDPCAWLLDGMRMHGVSGRLLAMLSNDVRRREGQVPCLITSDLLPENGAPNPFVNYVQTRWFVARSLSRFDVIEQDFDRLRNQFLDEPAEWQRLLLGAVRQLVLTRSARAAELLDSIHKELAGTPAGVSSNWLWDWLEATIALHSAWSDGAQRLLNPKYNPPYADAFGRLATDTDDGPLHRLVTLVERTWERTPMQSRSHLMDYCLELADDGNSSLADLTLIAKVSRPLLVRLMELLHEQRIEFGGDDDYTLTPAAESEVRRFVTRELWQTTRGTEVTVLHYCLREAVTPDDIASAIEGQSDLLPAACIQFAETLRYNLPLKCLVEAHRLLW